jgi:SAM-dependent methyltransferase
MNEEAVTRGRDQDKVWDYFQTEGAAIFEFAAPRLNYLFRRATCIARSRRLCVLNIGIGTGWLEGRCHDAGWTTFAVDPSLAAARGAAAKGAAAALAGVEALPFQDGAFDVVFSSEVFEHLTDDLLEQGVREVGRVLRPDGVLLGTVPHEEPLIRRQTVCPRCSFVHHAYGHHQSFTARRLEEIFASAGLEKTDMRVRAFPPFKQRNFVGKLKSAVWLVVGRFGSYAADSKIVFAARR